MYSLRKYLLRKHSPQVNSSKIEGIEKTCQQVDQPGTVISKRRLATFLRKGKLREVVSFSGPGKQTWFIPISRGVHHKWSTPRGVAHPIQPWYTKSGPPYESWSGSPRLQFWLPQTLTLASLAPNMALRALVGPSTLCLGPLCVLSHYMSGDTC